jgi:hypothetical protein
MLTILPGDREVRSMEYSIWINTETDLCPDLVSYTRIEPHLAAHYFDTRRGVAIARDFPNITFEVKDLAGIERCDSLWGGFPYLVFSPRLRDLLSASGVANLQYFGAEVYDRKTRSTLTQFRIANIVGTAACLDRERSDYEEWSDLPGLLKRVDKLVLDHDRFPEDLLLFRLEELPSVLLCHQDVVAALQEASIVGVDFCDPGAFTAGW